MALTSAVRTAASCELAGVFLFTPLYLVDSLQLCTGVYCMARSVSRMQDEEAARRPAKKTCIFLNFGAVYNIGGDTYKRTYMNAS